MGKGMMSMVFSSICRSVTAETAANAAEGNYCSGGAFVTILDTTDAVQAGPAPAENLFIRKKTSCGKAAAQTLLISIINAANCANALEARQPIEGHAPDRRFIS